jgi:hypothetical protein
MTHRDHLIEVRVAQVTKKKQKRNDEAVLARRF